MWSELVRAPTGPSAARRPPGTTPYAVTSHLLTPPTKSMLTSETMSHIVKTGTKMTSSFASFFHMFMFMYVLCPTCTCRCVVHFYMCALVPFITYFFLLYFPLSCVFFLPSMPFSSLCEKLEVVNIYSVHRAVEDSNFTHSMDNKQLLFHSSQLQNFVGILSR